MSKFDMNLGSISLKPYLILCELDKSYVGTSNYIGLAAFWASEYKHYLLKSTIPSRRKVHNIFLQEKLKLNGISGDHERIVKKYAKGYTKKGEKL